MFSSNLKVVNNTFLIFFFEASFVIFVCNVNCCRRIDNNITWAFLFLMQVNVSKETALAHSKYFHDVVSAWLHYSWRQPKRIAEIDETHLFNAKHNVGRVMTVWSSVWLFGRVAIRSGLIRTVLIFNRASWRPEKVPRYRHMWIINFG